MGARIARASVVSRRWLVLHLASPLMAFGAVAVDQVGLTWRWPGRSMLTGLFANALGWDWSDHVAHQLLQDRMACGAALLREGEILTDTQNAQLKANDKGWTTRGTPEGRAGGSYGAPHRRYRDYLADVELVAVVSLQRAAATPTLDDLRQALIRPVRPLYLGRKPCLPSKPFVSGGARDFLDADNAHAALEQAVTVRPTRAVWPDEEGPVGSKSHDVADMRHWRTGLHGGSRTVWEGYLHRDQP